jgi:hypothetical protein
MSLSRRELFHGAAWAVATGVVAPILALGATRKALASSTFQDDLTGALPPTFYVSSKGSDSSDGMTPQSAWATIQKANDSLPHDRSVLLLRRDDTFYGELRLPLGCEVGAFGSGAKPILTMYKVLNRAEAWIEHANGIWKIDLGSASTHEGYTASTDANIGFLRVDGAVKAALKFALSELSATWDFCCDIPNNVLYVQASANPTTLAADIKAAPKGNAHDATSTVIYCPNGANVIHDLHVTGTGGCGISGSGSDVHIHDCLIDYIGGSWLAGQASPNTRYGNAIEHWPNVSRWTIENNEIAEVYDVAWTCQGRDSDGGEIYWEDMTIRGNHIHDCGQTIELWSESANMDSPGFVRIVFERNRCERAGYGVFSDLRPDQDKRVHLLTYNLQTPVDITIQDNIFDDSYGAYSYHAFEPPIGYVTRNNLIRLKAGTKMEFQRSETVEQAAAWQAATGREIGSTITTLG